MIPATGRERMRGYLLILAAAVLWGTFGTVARVALAAGMTPMELAFWRAALGGGCFAAHAVVRRRGPVALRDMPMVVVFAVIGVAGFYFSYLEAVRQGGVALAAMLLYTAPAWVAAASAVLFRERLTTRVVGAIAITLTGVTLVALATGDVRASGGAIGWGLVASVTYAAYYIFGKRYFGQYDAATLLAWALPIGALCLAATVSFHAHPARAWWATAYLALVPTYLAYLLYGAALVRVPATRAATVATIEPVVAATLAYLVWGEALSALAYGGGALVAAGVLMVTTAPGDLAVSAPVDA